MVAHHVRVFRLIKHADIVDLEVQKSVVIDGDIAREGRVSGLKV